jgi:hypothetical protein
MQASRLAAALVVLVSISLVVTQAAHGQTTPQGAPQSPTGTQNPDTPRSEPSTSGSTRPSVGVGVQIDVGQVLGGLDKLRKAREERRRARKQAAADAAATATTLPKPVESLPKPSIPTQTSPAPQAPIAAPLVKNDEPRPVVMFSPSAKANPEPTPVPVKVMVPSAVPAPVRVPVAKPWITVTQSVPAVSKAKLPPTAITAAERPATSRPNKVDVRSLVRMNPPQTDTPIATNIDVKALPPRDLEVAIPSSPPTSQVDEPLTAPIAALPAPASAVTPVGAAPTQVTSPKNPSMLWMLWGLFGASLVGFSGLFRFLVKPKPAPNTKADSHDRPKSHITGQCVADTEPESVLTFDDGKDLLPAVLTGAGDTSSTLVFDDPAKAT